MAFVEPLLPIVHQGKNDSTSNSGALAFSWYMLPVEKKLPGQENKYGKILKNVPYERRVFVTVLIICLYIHLLLTPHVLNWIIKA